MNSPSEHSDPRSSGVAIEKVRLRHPRDLLAAIPYLLGFHPHDSVVVVAFSRRQVALTLRIDVQAVHDPPSAWAELSRPLSEAGTDGLAVVIYADHDAEHTVLQFAASSPWPVLDVLRAHDARWWSLTCPN
jgi:hypothetical protein